MTSYATFYTYLSSLEVLLQILTAGPVAAATNKRSFSAFSYSETYLRFKTKEACLNGFALLYVRRDLVIKF